MLGQDIDPASASLIVQLQLEDVELFCASSKGKSREPTSDEQAFRMQNEELQEISQIHLDRRMAESVAAVDHAETPETVSEEPEIGESSVRAAKRTQQPPLPMHRCVACNKKYVISTWSTYAVDTSIAVPVLEVSSKLLLQMRPFSLPNAVDNPAP
jgi:hypothetical protein